MIHQHLLQRAEIGQPAGAYLAGMHLDEDAISAFVEGRLGEGEAAPIISHLVSCNSCRRFTAELVRLDSEVGSAEMSAPPPSGAEPSRMRTLLERLEDLASRVLPSSEEVFAYHAPADDFEPKAEAKEQPAAGGQQSEQEDQADQKSK
jgi:hypothetical protein